ncbi:MAG: hypothetical protein P8123_00835 [bacterium]
MRDSILESIKPVVADLKHVEIDRGGITALASNGGSITRDDYTTARTASWGRLPAHWKRAYRCSTVPS